MLTLYRRWSGSFQVAGTLGSIWLQRREENQKLSRLVADDLKSMLRARGYYQGVVLSHE